jgi:hypothetical protein
VVNRANGLTERRSTIDQWLKCANSFLRQQIRKGSVGCKACSSQTVVVIPKRFVLASELFNPPAIAVSNIVPAAASIR